MAGFNQITTSVTIINSGLIGYQGISLTDFDATTVSAIAAGSGVEIASAFFKAENDITIDASSWTAITTATTAYLALTPSGTAGSQILSAEWTSTAPTWSTSKQGWYNAGETARIVISVYKDGTNSYSNKFILKPFQGSELDNIDDSVYSTATSSFSSTTDGAYYILPRGYYVIKLGYTSSGAYATTHELQIYINSTWAAINVSSVAGGFLYSDGLVFRLYVSSTGVTSACTSYWRTINL